MKTRADIYIIQHGKQKGPYLESDLRRLWAYGGLASDDWVWRHGMPDCVQLQHFFSKATLQALKFDGPPPIDATPEVVAAEPVRPPARVLPQSQIQLLQGVSWVCLMLSVAALVVFHKYAWVAGVAYPLSLTAAFLALWFRRSAFTWLAFAADVALPLVFFCMFLTARVHDKMKQPTPAWALPVSNLSPYSRAAELPVAEVVTGRPQT